VLPLHISTRHPRMRQKSPNTWGGRNEVQTRYSYRGRSAGRRFPGTGGHRVRLNNLGGIRRNSYQAGQQRHRYDPAADAAMRRRVAIVHRQSVDAIDTEREIAEIEPDPGRPRSGGTNSTGTTVAVSSATTGGRLILVSTSWPVTYTAGNAWNGNASKTASHEPRDRPTRGV
jgi:hypothetical protein